MKHLFFILLLLFGLQALGQETCEYIVNEIYLIKVDSSFTSYQLNEKATKLSEVIAGNETEITSDLKEHLSDDLVKYFLSKAADDTAVYYWNFSKLDQAVRTNEKYMNLVNSFRPFVISPKWSKARVESEREKYVKVEKARLSNIPLAQRTLFSFSRPITDSDETHMLIFLDSGIGQTSGHGCIYLFRKTNNKWSKIGSTRCRIS